SLRNPLCESGALPGSDEVGHAAVRARRPACGRARAVDGVEAAIVAPLPRRAEVGADVAAREPDGDRRVPVHPRDPGAVLRRRAGSEAPARAAVEAAGKAVGRGCWKREVGTNGDAPPLTAEGDPVDAGAGPEEHRRRCFRPGDAAVVRAEDTCLAVAASERGGAPMIGGGALSARGTSKGAGCCRHLEPRDVPTHAAV